MNKTKTMKLYCYESLKIIDTTVLVELLQKEILFEDEEIVNVYKINERIYITTSRNDIMEEIEGLYPNVFKPIEATSLNGNIIFSIK